MKETVFQRTPFLHHVLRGLLCLPLFIPLLYFLSRGLFIFFGIQFHATTFTKTIFFQALVEGALLVYLFLVLVEKRFRPFISATHFWLIILGTALFLTGLTGVDMRASFFAHPMRGDGLFFLLHIGVYSLLISWVVTEFSHSEQFFKVALLGGMLTIFGIALIMLFQHNGVWEWAHLQKIFTAVSGNPDFFAHYLLLLLGINAYFIFMRPAVWNHLAILPFFVFIVLSGSSTAVFLSLLYLGVIAWARLSRIKFYSAVFLSLGFVLALVVFKNAYAAELFSLWHSALARLYVWKDAVLTTLSHKPFFGFGWGNDTALWNFAASDTFAQFFEGKSHLFFDKMHNILVEFLVAGGLLAFIAFCIFWGRLMLIVLLRYLKTKDSVWAFFILAFLTQFIFLQFNFDMLMSYILVSVLLASCLFFVNEQRVFFPPSLFSSYGGILIGAAALFMSSLFLYYNFQALYAHFLMQHAAVVAKQTAFDSRKVGVIDQLIDRSRSLNQPYDLLQEEAVAVYKYVSEAYNLSEEHREMVYRNLFAIYRDLQSVHPRNPVYYYELASLEKKFTSNFQQAIEYLKQARLLAPARILFRVQLALLYIEADELEEAEALLQELAAENYYPALLNFYRAVILFKQGNGEEGERALLHATAAYMPNTLEWRLLNIAFLEHGTKQALLALYRQIATFSHEVPVYANILSLAHELREDGVAEHYFNEMNRLLPGKQEELFLLLSRP